MYRVTFPILLPSMKKQRGIMRPVSMIFLICLLYSGVTASVYYVSPSGDNGQSGDTSHPWRTIQFAVDQLTPGDTVYVTDGVYNELVVLHMSGTEERPIVLRAAPGAHPIIDGSGLDGNEPALIKITDQAGIVIEGFELRNVQSENFASGIWVRGHSHHITVRQNIIHDIGDPNPDGGAHGLAFYGTDGNAAMHHIIVEDNELYNLHLKWSEACAFNGNVRDFIVRGNILHDVDNIGFVFIGFEGECADCSGGENQDRARNGRVYNNTVYNVDSKDNPPYNGERSAGGIYVDGGRDITIEGNRIFQCNIGVEVASEHGGKNAAGVIVRNNFIYSNHVAGLSTGGYDVSVGATDSCFFVNNSFYNNHTSSRSTDDWGAEILLNYHVHDNVFENNIVYASEGYPRVLTVGSDVVGNRLDYNLYAGSEQGEAPGDHSIISDPLYVDPFAGDLHITRTSPAVDKGTLLDSAVTGTEDIDGDERVKAAGIDMGADETGKAMKMYYRMKSALPFELETNYPNPFNPLTTIRFKIHKRMYAVLQIFNNKGQSIYTPARGVFNAGEHRLIFNARNLAAGVYYLRLISGARQQTRRMVLLK